MIGAKGCFPGRFWRGLLSRTRLLLLLMVLLLSFVSAPRLGPLRPAAGSASFKFAAAGGSCSGRKYKFKPSSACILGRRLLSGARRSKLRERGREADWCDIVKSYVGPNFPFELVSGFHDDGLESPPNDGGLIDNFVKCLRDQMGSTGMYGKEYYFDYPPSNPLARIIMISPDLYFSNGGYYPYTIGSTHYEWLSSVVDGARAVGITWVIVQCTNHAFPPDYTLIAS